MKETDRVKIRNIKSTVIAMLEDRQSVKNSEISIASPSKYWTDFCAFFDYMIGLPEEYFLKLRLHTYHLTGDNYQIYYFGDPDLFLVKSKWDELIRGIPSAYILNEPEGGIGFHYDDGRFISVDVLRYQRVVSTLYRFNILPELSSVNRQRGYILEIGAGYGGMAHHLCNICPNTTYIIVDLPEVLLFTASYLSLLNPKKKIYIYERSNSAEFLNPDVIETYDFVLVPNYKLNLLSHLRFDLAINVASLQEMRNEQVEQYLDFIRETCRGVFYSWNQDHQPRNKELFSLSDMLRQRFDLIKVVDRAMKKVGVLRRLKYLVRRKTPDLPYQEYICMPLHSLKGEKYINRVMP